MIIIQMLIRVGDAHNYSQDPPFPLLLSLTLSCAIRYFKCLFESFHFILFISPFIPSLFLCCSDDYGYQVAILDVPSFSAAQPPPHQAQLKINPTFISHRTFLDYSEYHLQGVRVSSAFSSWYVHSGFVNILD